MKLHDIHIMALQEHNMPQSNTFKSNKYHFYMSQCETRGLGVAIVVSPKLAPYVTKVICNSSRLMSIEIAVEGHRYIFFSTYTPHSGTQLDEERAPYWEQLQAEISKLPKTAFYVIAGDLNTRLHARMPGEEQVIGPHVYGLGPLHVQEHMKNRKHLMAMCHAEELCVAHTFKATKIEQQVTHDSASTQPNPTRQYAPERYGAIDHFLVPNAGSQQ
jgi:exonuclease III